MTENGNETNSSPILLLRVTECTTYMYNYRKQVKNNTKAPHTPLNSKTICSSNN